MKNTTKQQLIGYGLSEYQASTITKGLTPVGKEGRKNSYSLVDAIASIKERTHNRKIKTQTRSAFLIVLMVLMERLNNVVPAPFNKGTDPELSKLSKKAFEAMVKVDSHINEMKATAATLKGKNGLRKKAV